MTTFLVPCFVPLFVRMKTTMGQTVLQTYNASLSLLFFAFKGIQKQVRRISETWERSDQGVLIKKAGNYTHSILKWPIHRPKSADDSINSKTTLINASVCWQSDDCNYWINGHYYASNYVALLKSLTAVSSASLREAQKTYRRNIHVFFSETEDRQQEMAVYCWDCMCPLDVLTHLKPCGTHVVLPSCICNVKNNWLYSDFTVVKGINPLYDVLECFERPP